MITVRQLIDQLSDLKDDMVVLISSDEEGNHIRNLCELEGGLYYKDQGEFFLDEEGVYPDDALYKAVVLWP